MKDVVILLNGLAILFNHVESLAFQQGGCSCDISHERQFVMFNNKKIVLNLPRFFRVDGFNRSKDKHVQFRECHVGLKILTCKCMKDKPHDPKR